MPTLVQEGDNSFVRDGVSNCVSRSNHPPKLLYCVFILLHYRRAGKGNKAGIRERFSHPRMHRPILRSMAFINQNKYVRTVTSKSDSRRYGFELVHNSRDDSLPLSLKHVGKICSGRRLLRIDSTMPKGAMNLVIEIYTVRDKNNFVIVPCLGP